MTSPKEQPVTTLSTAAAQNTGTPAPTLRVHPIDGTIGLRADGTSAGIPGVHPCARIDVTAERTSLAWQIERAEKMLAADPHCWPYLHNVGRSKAGVYSFCDTPEQVVRFVLEGKPRAASQRTIRALAPGRVILVNVEDGPTAFKVLPEHRAEIRDRLMNSGRMSGCLGAVDALWRPEHPRYRAAMVAWTRTVLTRVQRHLTAMYGPNVCNYDGAAYVPGPVLGGWPVVGHGDDRTTQIDGPELYVREGGTWGDHRYEARLEACTADERVPWVASHALRHGGGGRLLTIAEITAIRDECLRHGVADVALWRATTATDAQMLWAAGLYAGARPEDVKA